MLYIEHACSAGGPFIKSNSNVCSGRIIIHLARRVSPRNYVFAHVSFPPRWKMHCLSSNMLKEPHIGLAFLMLVPLSAEESSQRWDNVILLLIHSQFYALQRRTGTPTWHHDMWLMHKSVHTRLLGWMWMKDQSFTASSQSAFTCAWENHSNTHTHTHNLSCHHNLLVLLLSHLCHRGPLFFLTASPELHVSQNCSSPSHENSLK